MSPQEIVDAIVANLEAERVAVIALDGPTVSALGEEKDRLVALLAQAKVPRELLPRLKDLVAMARHNCQLIAHARESLRGTAALVASALPGGTAAKGEAPRRGVRVSVTG